MRRALVLTLLAALAAAVPAHAAAPRCSLKGARFISKSPRAMLFSVAVKPRTVHRGKGKHRHKLRIVSAIKRRYFGCRYGHRPVLLTVDIRPHARGAARRLNSTFRIGGTWVGWVGTTVSHSGSGAFSRAIHIRSLAGDERSIDVLTDHASRVYRGIPALKVGSDGAVAFALTAAGGAVEIDGIARTAKRTTAIAYARGIAPASLQLGDGAVTYKQHGAVRSMRLRAPPSFPGGGAKGPQGLYGRFGDCGTLIPAPVKASPAQAVRVAAARNGELLAAGTATSGNGARAVADTAIVTRFSAAGLFDHRFGTGGAVQTRVPNAAAGRGATLTGLVVQSDGKSVISVNTHDTRGNSKPVLMRYGSAGKLDASFGSGGIVRSAVPAASSAAIDNLALAPDGGLIAVGQRDGRWFVARFRANGTRDPAFGSRGMVTDPGSKRSIARAVVVSGDGTIAFAGAVGPGPLLERLAADGMPIRATKAAPPASAGLFALEPLRGGGWAAAGAATNVNGSNQALVVRYAADGALDETFGRAGFVLDPQVDGARALAVEADGSLLVSATFNVGAGGTGAGDGLVHYTTAGKRDAGFGFHGALGGTASAGIVNADIILGDDGSGYVAQKNGVLFGISRFALAGPALTATQHEPSVCAMLVSTKLGPLLASHQLPIGLRLRRPGRLHLHATVTVGGRTVVLGDQTTPQTTIEAAVASLHVSKAATALMAHAKAGKIVIRGGLPGRPARRYTVTIRR